MSKVTTSIDAVPVGLQANTVWHDSTSSYNNENVYYDNGNTYARWKSTSYGWIFSIIADVGNESVADFFKLQDYPDTITVSGTGTALDGDIPFAFFNDSRPAYEGGGSAVVASGGQWNAFVDIGLELEDWENPPGDYLPPSGLWPTVGSKGSPAPTLSYTIPTNQYIGQGAWSGTLLFFDNFSSIVFDTSITIAGSQKGKWLLTEGTGTTATDTSGNGNDGTITDPTWVTSLN